MKLRFSRALVAAFLLLSVYPALAQKDEIIILQFNDVYELWPLEMGRYGGLARVATLRNRLKQESPHLLTVLSGDFLSPSAIGTSKLEGKRISGAHMVDVLNRVGVTHVTFGNHEFDIRKEELQERINESSFRWISSNVQQISENGIGHFTQTRGGVREPLPEFGIVTMNFPRGDGSVRRVRIGLIGLTIDNNKRDYLLFENPIESARRVVRTLKGRIDYLIAITHLTIEQDMDLARQVPEIQLILGGHEHTNMAVRAGNALITKADANVKSVYVHRLLLKPGSDSLELHSELNIIDEKIPDDSTTAYVANKWIVAAFDGFRSMGLEPDKIVTSLHYPLDFRELVIRHRPAEAAELIATAMLEADPSADCAIVNSGSIRVDDIVSGTVTQYDIIRTLPFGGRIFTTTIKGSLLQRILDVGVSNKGSGGYLQWRNIAFDPKVSSWMIKDQVLHPESSYRVVLTEFLLTGAEANLDFLRRDNPGISNIHEPPDLTPNDIRQAVIHHFQRNQ